MKTDFLFGIVASTKTLVRCVICGVSVPKAKKCIEEHTNGAKHKENLELMNINGILYNDNAFYCKACTLELTEQDSVSEHIHSDEHTNWLVAVDDLIEGEYIDLDAFLSTDADDAHCEVCMTYFLCTLPNIEAHVNSVNHRKNLVEHLKPENGIFAVDTINLAWCKICNYFFINSTENVLEHIDEDIEHLEWLDTIEELIEDEDITIDNFLTDSMDNYAFCNRCQMAIFCNVDVIEYHINSEPHID